MKTKETIEKFYKEVKVIWVDAECPVCKSKLTRKDFDFPETMLCCENCLSDFLDDGEVILNAREIK